MGQTLPQTHLSDPHQVLRQLKLANFDNQPLPLTDGVNQTMAVF